MNTNNSQQKLIEILYIRVIVGLTRFSKMLFIYSF